MKQLFIISIILLSFSACKDKVIQEPEPDEYFSFYADGEYFNYPQKRNKGFLVDGHLLEAYKLGTTQFVIQAGLENNPWSIMSIYFPGGHIPDRDTIELSAAGIQHFKEMDVTFGLRPPLTGRVIFSERTESRLTGTFEFQAYLYLGRGVYSDSILTISGGKFSIIPSK